MEAIILSGIQGSGKSSLCQARYWDSHLRINYDMLRTRHREALLLQACLAAKQALIIDATNPTRDDRQRYLQPCQAAGYRIIGIEFRIALPLAMARNVQRQGKARVPDAALRAFVRKREALDFAEGFDEIWIMNVTEEAATLTRHRAEA